MFNIKISLNDEFKHVDKFVKFFLQFYDSTKHDKIYKIV